MLASHSHVFFLPETAFFRRFVMTREFERLPKEAIGSILENDSRLKRLDRDLKTIVENNLEDSFVAKSIYESFFKDDSNLEFYGDKDPRNVEYISPILSMWPDAKIIHIYRDPRDILASKKKAAWSKDKSLFFHLVAGAAQFALARDFESSSLSLIHI